jgi:hypothetical protein
MLDLNLIDNIGSMVYPPPNYLDMEEYIERKSVIFSQLQDLDNLGSNLLKDIEEGGIKDKIYRDIIDYTRDNYLEIFDKDYILNSAQLSQTANTIYQFLCVDGFNIIIPKILEQTDIQSIQQFDRLLIHNRSDYNYIKKHMINNVGDVLKNLQKLKNIDHVIAEDEQYKNLINRFGNYLELVDFSDCEKFTENYLRPLLNKYFPQLLWRTLSGVN